MSKEIDLNMHHITLHEFSDYIRDRIEMEEYQSPVLGLGKSGIGKTESMENAVATPLGINMIQMRLGSYEDTDLTGIPMAKYDEGAGKEVVKFADMGKLPNAKRDGEVGILVFDEFTAATSRVRAAALQLTDSSRSVGDYTLPPKWLIVILGNGPGDGGYFQGLEYALMGRADCFRIDCSFTEWKAWAIKNQVHPVVIAFIEQNGGESMLHRIKDMDEAEYEEKDANPRSWVKLSTHLKKKEERLGTTLSERQVQIYAGGAVGADIAVEFAAFYRYQDELIPVEEVFSGAALKRNLKAMKTETLYINSIHIANAVANIMLENRKKIENDEPLDKATENKIRNMIKFVEKLGETQVDLATSIWLSIDAGSEDLWHVFTYSEYFDEVFPEYLELALDNYSLSVAKLGIDQGFNKKKA